jgi:chlorophyll synthase
MTLNDFKSMEGDRRMGVRSLPVQLGETGAARMACFTMSLPQLGVVALLAHWQRPTHALTVAGLVLAQWVLMAYFLKNVRKRALWYSGFGVPLFVAGMMVSAFALRTMEQAA